MKFPFQKYQFTLCVTILFLFIGCSTPATLTDIESLERANVTAKEVISIIPDYGDHLFTISGSGRAIVSEPGNNERVTIHFQSNRDESLIQIRSGTGIEGGQIYVDRDSLMVYNRIDRKAEKVPLHEGNLSSVGSLASVNMLDLFNYTVDPDSIEEIYADHETGSYVLLLTNKSLIRISQSDGHVQNVVHANDNRSAPYSKLEYEGYSAIEELLLPRRITIYSKDGNSRATLLVQRLNINPTLPPLGIDLPDDIPVIRL